MAIKLGAALEPRMIMLVLSSVVEKVIEDDAILKRVWFDKIMQPHLRKPSRIWDVLTLVRMMTGE
eukprot:10976423-Prorocentrum_lima.AAC.1